MSNTIQGFIMKVTSKGQVTIPQDIREKMGITPSVEVDFIAEKGRVYLVERKSKTIHQFYQLF